MASSVGTAYLTLVPKMKDGWQNGVSSSVSSGIGPQMNAAGGTAGNGFSSGFGASLKALAKSAVVLGAAKEAGELFMASFNAYADYEQLVGGVETLFDKSAGVVVGYARNAYATAGLSANEYMETVTGFSASLLQSLDNNTAAAAEYANMAITDMSDNANKMGTDMASIQNAYQGFAKNNYTMLDNLKLGYGGTKEEMERLIAKANELRAAQGLNADLTIKSYADVVEAINTVQKSMGISGYKYDELNAKIKEMSLSTEEVEKVAKDMKISYDDVMKKMEEGTLSVRDAQILLGTTAREASTTVSGSMNAAKAAWMNLVTDIGGGGENIKEILKADLSALGEMFGIMAENVLSVAGNIFSNIGTLIAEQLPVLVQNLVTYVKDHGPDMLNAAIDFLLNIVTGIAHSIPTIMGAIPGIVLGMVQALWERKGDIFNAGVDLIAGLIEGIKARASAIVDCIKEICSNALDAVKRFFGIKSPSRVMMQMGNYIGEGMAIGIEETEGDIARAWDSATSGIGDVTASLGAGGGISGGSVYNIGDVSLNVSDLKDIVTIEQLANMFRRAKGMGAAWA